MLDMRQNESIYIKHQIVCKPKIFEIPLLCTIIKNNDCNENTLNYNFITQPSVLLLISIKSNIISKNKKQQSRLTFQFQKTVAVTKINVNRSSNCIFKCFIYYIYLQIRLCMDKMLFSTFFFLPSIQLKKKTNLIKQ